MRRLIGMLTGGMVAAAMAGCNGMGAGPGATGAQGQATPLTKLSQYKNATYSDVVIGNDGTIHVIFEEERPETDFWQVFYRSSSDGGATWTAPVNLTESDTTHQGGFIRLVKDGQGRIYAFWKWFTGDELIGEASGSGDTAGTLVYRTLDGGNWSAPVPVSKPDLGFSWFPSVDAKGQLWMVWGEGQKLDIAGPPVTAKNSVVYQATITGTTVGGPTQVLQGQGGGTDPSKLDEYQTLRGYVDANGVARFVSQKAPVAHPYQPDIVYWDGKQEKTLFPLSQNTSLFNDYTNSPPELVADAQGTDHMIYWDQKAMNPAMLDYPLPGGNPTTIYATADTSGKVENFTTTTGPGGQIVVLFTALEKFDVDSAPDLYLLTTANGAWTKAVNLTNNAARASSTYAQTEPVIGSHIATSTTYSPLYGFAAVAPDGHVDVAMVNAEKEIVDGVTTTSGGFGSTSQTEGAYFLTH